MQKQILGLIILIQFGCTSQNPFSSYQIEQRPEHADQGQAKAILVMFAGEVTLQSANGTNFAALPALPLLSNDHIITQSNSFAIVHLHNNHVVRLDDSLRLQVSNLAMFGAKNNSMAVGQQLTNLLKPEERSRPERIVGWHARIQAAQSVTSVRETEKPVTPSDAKPKKQLVSKLDQASQKQPKSKPSKSMKNEQPVRSKTKSHTEQKKSKRQKPKKAPRSASRVKGKTDQQNNKTQKISRKFTKPGASAKGKQTDSRALIRRSAPIKKLRRATPKTKKPTIARWRIDSDKDWKRANTLPDPIKQLFQQQAVLTCLRSTPTKNNKLQLSLRISKNRIEQIRALGSPTPRCWQSVLKKQKLPEVPDQTIQIEVVTP